MIMYLMKIPPDGIEYYTEYIDVFKTNGYNFVFSDEYIDINYRT